MSDPPQQKLGLVWHIGAGGESPAAAKQKRHFRELALIFATTLRAVAQMTTNGWRAFLRYRLITWQAMPGYVFGSLIAFAILTWISLLPPTVWV